MLRGLSFLLLLVVLVSKLQAEDFLGFQDRITEVFNQKKSAVMRVCGLRGTLSQCKSSNELEQPQLEVGTGFFISREGHIVTIADIVKDASLIFVEYNEVMYQAELVGCDDITNIAILRLCKPVSNLSFLHVGESLDLPSPSVILLGVTCKMGMAPGPSMGMVTGQHTAFFEKAFPTTYLRSSIPSDDGESGSPVFDLSGRFVGVMIWSYPPIRSSFIMPARAVMRVRDDLIFSGKVSYAFFGIEIDKEASLACGTHLVIGKVTEGGPADEAGIKGGDKMLEFDSVVINHVMDLHNATFFARPGQLIPVKVLRGEKELKLTVRLKEQPAGFSPIPKRASIESEKVKETIVVQAEVRGTNLTSQGPQLSQDALSKVKEITQKGDRWRNYFKSE